MTIRTNSASCCPLQPVGPVLPWGVVWWGGRMLGGGSCPGRSVWGSMDATAVEPPSSASAGWSALLTALRGRQHIHESSNTARIEVYPTESYKWRQMFNNNTIVSLSGDHPASHTQVLSFSFEVNEWDVAQNIIHRGATRKQRHDKL